MDTHTVGTETRGYILVRGRRALLIDCPRLDVVGYCHRHGLVCPDTVLHTQVQTEHCWEWEVLPDAKVYVAAGSEDVARRSAAFARDSKTVWPPDRPWAPESAGVERYGIGGCPTARPPERPLNVVGGLHAGDHFQWENLRLTVLPLPGSGKRAVGFYAEKEGVLFSGDLLRAGGFLVNFYDLERGYGPTLGYDELIHSLETVAALKPRLLLPSTGPAITEPARDIQRLLRRLAAARSPAVQRPGMETPRPPLREFGLWKEVAPGLCQNNNFGNCIVYIDAEGRGLCVDPDICVWKSWEENCAAMHAELDRLEAQAGLKRLEWALLTHYHGDHVQYCDLLRERYGTEILATADVADVLAHPEAYRYPCCVDWYGFPFNAVQVDRRLGYEETHRWNGMPVTPIHTPGHCFAHAGFIIPWEGMTTVCTGDTLQYAGGPVATAIPPILYNDTAWPARGVLRTYERVMEAAPDLVLGGHSHCFFEPGEVLEQMRLGAEEAMGRALTLVADGDLMGAMTPPGYDEKRPDWRRLLEMT